MPRFQKLQKHIFICNNKRSKDDPRGSCSERGSDDLLDYAKKRIHELGLKGEIRVNKAGCLDACTHGPAMVVFPDDVWYSPMVVFPDDVWYSPKTKNDIEIIIEHHIQNNNLAKELVIDFRKNS